MIKLIFINLMLLSCQTKPATYNLYDYLVDDACRQCFKMYPAYKNACAVYIKQEWVSCTKE